MFYPYVTISVAQVRKSDDLRHAMSPFSLFLYSFSGALKNLGICEVTKDNSCESSKKKVKKEHLWAAFGGALKLGQPLRGQVT